MIATQLWGVICRYPSDYWLLYQFLYHHLEWHQDPVEITDEMPKPRSLSFQPAPQPHPVLDQSVLQEVEQIGVFLDTIKTHFEQASDLAELGVFSSMFAHEVNNLMTQVGGRAQLALMNMDNPNLSLKALQAACHASTQIAQLSEIFLESTQTDSKYTAQYHVCEIHHRSLEFISDENLEAYGFKIEEVDPDIQISIPPILLQQVLLNIYLNAARSIEVKSCSSGTKNNGQISTKVERTSPGESCSTGNKSMIKITIQDNGIGMDADQVQMIFQTWEQDKEQLPVKIANDERERGRGHGLGLSVCKKLLADAHGSITAESVPDVGTKMIITLPESDQKRSYRPA